ncbi:MAG: hypothetical protein HXY34_03555, partial [Candidatus Thorarchaeota archaeon]|nr:hypothetical protein [Candidatus Thorarchaeota archaeon]
MNREGFRTHTLFVVLVTISLLICSIPRSAAVELGVSPTASESEYQGVGPSIDTLTFNVIPGIEQKIEALVNDEIDIIGSEVYPAYLPTLEAAENVEVEKSPRNGCGQMIINCAKYPLNITAFRRALAFAVDKHRISEDVWDGLAQPQDSCVPSGNPWSSEGKLGYDYYQANALRGNQILDAAGFVDLDSDGIREAPNGSEFSVVIECASSSDVAIETGAIVAEALQALHIDATSMAVDFYDYLDRLYIHGDFDMCFIGKSFNDFDVDWLAYEYWSEYADEPYYNFPMFKNASYDSWRDQLLHSTDY